MHIPVYRNVCVCPPMTKSISGTYLANSLSFSYPACPKPIIILIPWVFNFLTSVFTVSLMSSNLMVGPVQKGKK